MEPKGFMVKYMMWFLARIVISLFLIQGHQAHPTSLSTANWRLAGKKKNHSLLYFSEISWGQSDYNALQTWQTNFLCQFFPRTSQLLLPCWTWLDNTPAKRRHSLYRCTTLVLHACTHTHTHARTHTAGHTKRHRNQSSSMCTCMQL